MSELGKVEKTERGFEIIRFEDAAGTLCNVQLSSAIDYTHRGFENPGSSFVWLGPSGLQRCHLSREQVAGLVAVLNRWLETGRFSNDVKRRD